MGEPCLVKRVDCKLFLYTVNPEIQVPKVKEFDSPACREAQ